MSINTYLGFDVGTKRTGVAIANSLTAQATGIKVIKHHKNGSTNWAAFDDVVSAHNINKLIVGLPFDQKGKEQTMTFIAKSFGKKLKNRYQIEVELIDEYLSSNEAKKLLKYNHHHHNAQRGDVDKQSSQLILQTWLNEKRFD
ncbi:Holliday junction resolvase RuvX [Candidatus Ruthia endofausta]|uniref:Putative pre-16S rRNA nuclease n=1 Tax=Candidatus Ruthia endofausta TaxID=2738852 RepID=A0A6N0HQN1_9GAMM|nr:Holliday junction resolvase RuvX [Candidatus Ruthia endofausta]QKQ24636.1 Holliday junction resolvase RuvX [Candidatus Ruthia endofausta]